MTLRSSFPGSGKSAAPDTAGNSRTALTKSWSWLPPLFRILAFAIATLVTSVSLLSPTLGDSEIRIIWMPLALLSYAFTWLPRREAPIYALIYSAVALSQETIFTPAFDLTTLAVQIAMAWALAATVPKHLTRTQMIMQPIRVIAYIFLTLLITLIGATLRLAAALTLDLSPDEWVYELAGSAAHAWRHWWLGNACAFVTITGSLTFLTQTSRDDWGEIWDVPRERLSFILLSGTYVAATMIVLPVFDLYPLGLPPDVRLGLLLIPMMMAVGLTGRFKGFGAAFALLAGTIIAAMSIGGPYAERNWAGLPPMATPVQLSLIVTAAMCWVLATTLRRLQWAMRDAIEAGNVKSRFIAMMNHELRTPLNAILGFSELMRLRNLKEMGEAIGPVENIHASGQRLLAMIEGLLNQADHGAGAFELEKQPVDVHGAFAAAVEDMRPDYEELGVGLGIDVEEGLTVDADPRALRQMLHVLLSYPLRFVGPDTKVALSARHSGTDTLIEVDAAGLINASRDDRDKLEMQLVNALALAHGARLRVVQDRKNGRLSRLTFFATRAAS